jgi:hypothetical protein
MLAAAETHIRRNSSPYFVLVSGIDGLGEGSWTMIPAEQARLVTNDNLI